MAERKYSVGEIDHMRRCIRFSYPSGVSYYEQERAAEIENRLRTYMQNGTDPRELDEMMSAIISTQQKMQQTG